VTGYGPPDDPSEAPTGYYDYGGYGDDGQQQPEPGSPWYRRRVVLLVLGLFAAVLLGLAIYLVADRSNGRGGSTPTSTSPTTSTAVTTSTTTPATTTTEVPVAPAPTTSLTNPPTTGEPTTTAPTTTPPTSTSIDDGHHHHHHHFDGGTP
jgi:hypothetical protein